MGQWCLGTVYKMAQRAFPMEQQIYHCTVQKLINFKPKLLEEDKWARENGHSRTYVVKEVYGSLMQLEQGEDDKLLEQVWISASPSKVAGFLWKHLRNRLPTMDVLSRRGINVGNMNSRCIFCKEEDETVDHLFITCQFAKNVWTTCYNWINAILLPANSFSQHFSTHVPRVRGKNKKKWWIMLWLVTSYLVKLAHEK
ncbi:hypothetical protein RIF29_15555 [Crotalaria pallida]|uniref:Reverse transcriptase zinc-binding domain-containing protein n=1 Tax=Crotalaria pallida TaxID=3830 RepID=A0AAN9IER3_CROPI